MKIEPTILYYGKKVCDFYRLQKCSNFILAPNIDTYKRSILVVGTMKKIYTI
jgi:hypothetical protein